MEQEEEFQSYPYLERINNKVYGGHLRIKQKIVGAHDCNWAEEHNLFYSKQYRLPFVDRLILVENRKPVGFAHIRPQSDHSEVSETYLSPPRSLLQNKNTFLTCASWLEDYGYDAVYCVPYIMPDTLFGMCIQASLWICIRTLNQLSNGMVKTLDIPRIQTMAKGHPFADGEGLLFKHATRILRMCGCTTFYFSNYDLSFPELELCLYAYIESGFPVIVGVDVSKLKWWDEDHPGYHSIVAIGHTIDRNGLVDGYIFHDESTYPYQPISSNELKKCWRAPSDPSRKVTREAIVALPPSVSIPFQVAFKMYDGIMTVLSEEKFFNRNLFSSVIRPKLINSNELASMLLKLRATALLLQKTNGFAFLTSPYYWVFSLLSEKRNNLRGLAIIDATDPSRLMLFYSDLEGKAAIFQKGKYEEISTE